MSFFGNIRASQAKGPVRKSPCVVHPENAPRTIGDACFPENFDLYEYAGAALETVVCKEPDGTFSRRPALVAKMVHRYQSEEGVSVIEEMTASIADLTAYNALRANKGQKTAAGRETC